MVTLVRNYEMECAHQLTAGLPPQHKCRRPHGHRYEVQLRIKGEVDENGILIEYDDLDSVVWPVLRLADHNSLNTLGDRCSTPEARLVAENPTVERIAIWIGTRLEGLVRSSKADGQRVRLMRVSVQEDSRSGAEWEKRGDSRPSFVQADRGCDGAATSLPGCRCDVSMGEAVREGQERRPKGER